MFRSNSDQITRSHQLLAPPLPRGAIESADVMELSQTKTKDTVLLVSCKRKKTFAYRSNHNFSPVVGIPVNSFGDDVGLCVGETVGYLSEQHQ